MIDIIKSKKIHLEKSPWIPKHKKVKITETNTQLQTQICAVDYNGNNIIRIDTDHYKVRRTGEIKEFHHSANRTSNISSIAQSMKRLRDIINSNVDDVKKITWLTLTYKENMQDEKQMYDDFRKFNMRLKYYCDKNNLPNYEYICTVEYQARGALHAHVILIWDSDAPFIANDVMANIWSHGFTKTQALHGNSHNLGNYLCTYLTDLPIADAIKNKSDLSKYEIVEKQSKKYVKASRLSLYPTGCKLYRCSKGIKKPTVYKVEYEDLNKILESKNALLEHEQYLYLYEESCDNGIFPFSQTIQYRYYNITNIAQERVKLYHSYLVSKYYRNLYAEMLFIHETMPIDEYEYAYTY